MKSIWGFRGGCWVVAAISVVLPICGVVAAPEPHPTQKDRWIERRGEVVVEYSAGDEAYLDSVFAAVSDWRMARTKHIAALDAKRREVVPFTPTEMAIHRDEILRKVAAEIGLPGPTAIQGRTYDAMLEHYALIGLVRGALAESFVKFTDFRTVAFWRKTELTARLKAGETVPQFSYVADKDEVNFDFSYSFQGEADDEARRAIEAQRLDHGFNYHAGADGVVDFSASFTLARGAKFGEPLRPAEPSAKLARAGATMKQVVSAMEQAAFPMVITPANAGLPPGEFCAQEIRRAQSMLQNAEQFALYRELLLAHVVLHEAIEVGIVENYLGSADRRWLCDGTANYVGWKIIRDRTDVATADQAYPLAAQLAQFAFMQDKINLRQWPAVENETELQKQSGLMRAHYPFATRALFNLVQQSGEAAVPKLFQEIARTPRRKVNMAVVEKAYAKVTKKKLADLLKQAEQAPVPTPVTPTEKNEEGEAKKP